MGAGLGESHPSQGGQPFLWEPSFRRAVGPGAVLVTGQGLAKKCSYRGPLLGGKRACPPAAWAEPGDSLGTWAGVTGISVWRGVRADRGGLGLGLSSVLLPLAGVAHLRAGEQVVYRAWRQAQGAPLAGGKEHEVSREAAQDGDPAAGQWPDSHCHSGGDCHSEPRRRGLGGQHPLPALCGWGVQEGGPS